MPTQYPEIFAALCAPFRPNELKSRAGGGGRKLTYVTARTVMNRLDEVLGPENWEDYYEPMTDGAVQCRLTVRLPDDSRVSKTGVGGVTTMSDASDTEKTGESDALKRAAVKFGVARYLYQDGVPDYQADQSGNRQEPKRQAGASSAPSVPDHPADTRSRGERLRDWAVKEGRIEQAKVLAQTFGCADLALATDETAKTIYQVMKQTSKIAPKAEAPSASPALTRDEQMRAESKAEIDRMIESIKGENPKERLPDPPVSPYQEPGGPGRNTNGTPLHFSWPHSGAALFAWCKRLEQGFRRSIIKEVEHEFCRKSLGDASWNPDFRTWDTKQVEKAAMWVAEMVSGFPGYAGQFEGKLVSVADARKEIREVACRLIALVEGDPTEEGIRNAINDFSEDAAMDIDSCESPTVLADLLGRMKTGLQQYANL